MRGTHDRAVNECASELWVLAGGLGSRLRAAVPDVPKALAPVGDRAFLSYAIENWQGQGIKSFKFLLRHQAHLIEAFLEQEKRSELLNDCEVGVVIEPAPLDTGGAVAHGVRQTRKKGPFLVTNADTWLGSGIKALSQVAAPAMAVAYVDDARRYGRVEVASERVVKFAEKQNGGGGLINAGMYHLNSDLFTDWDGAAFSLERDLFPRLLAGEGLAAVRVEAEFLDIGVPCDYLRFCDWIAAGRKTAL